MYSLVTKNQHCWYRNKNIHAKIRWYRNKKTMLVTNAHNGSLLAVFVENVSKTSKERNLLSFQRTGFSKH